MESIFNVMAGLVPAIHVLERGTAAKAWMPATSAGMTPKGSYPFFAAFQSRLLAVGPAMPSIRSPATLP